jgi:SAM-dependent methyltransferase
MDSMEALAEKLYSRDEYMTKWPSLHEECSPWKVSKIIPLLEAFMGCVSKDEISLLDVGGGAGSILSAVSNYVEKTHGVRVRKTALDLSPAILEIQKKNNPDLTRCLNEDVRKSSLGNKEIDLALLIDVLEHVPNPVEALEELKRFSHFAILKVPLEDSLLYRTWNFLGRGKPRKRAVEEWGHINVYSFGTLKREIEQHTGLVLNCYFTNAFHHFRTSEHHRGTLRVRQRLLNFVASYVFMLSPRLCSAMFGDFVMILVKCY